MWGLARELSKNFMIKVFADYVEKHKNLMNKATFSIERVGGPKLLRKYRKAYLVDEFVKNSKVNGIVADHWKSLEHLKTSEKKILFNSR
jgi:phosphatidylinositol alpha-1,6-mannosyltransferase